jgi:hypothetical protein
LEGIGYETSFITIVIKGNAHTRSHSVFVLTGKLASGKVKDSTKVKGKGKVVPVFN